MLASAKLIVAGALCASAEVREGYRCAHNGFTLQIHRVFRLVGQMRAPVLHFGDAAVPICPADPLGVGDFLVMASAIQTTQVFLCGVLDSFRFRQPLQVLLPIFSVVLAHDAFHGRVGFQGGGVQRHRLAPQQSLLPEQTQHEHEKLIKDQLRQPSADDGHRLMHRRVLGDRDAQKGLQDQTVGTMPSDPALGIQTLEVADQEHAEINPGRNARIAARDEGTIAVKPDIHDIASYLWITLLLVRFLLRPTVFSTLQAEQYSAEMACSRPNLWPLQACD